MPDVTEFYADAMVGFSISKDGAVAKMVFVSNAPDEAGKITEINKTILTMPVSGMQELLNDMQRVFGKSAEGETKN